MLQVNFLMIYTIHKISVLLKITRILKRFLKIIIDLFFFKKTLIKFFHNIMIKSGHNIMIKSSRPEEI